MRSGSRSMRSDELLAEQLAYYRARAPEYDEWFNRAGRYDRGPEQRARWCDEVATVDAALRALAPLGDVLEFACGTGIWTERLARIAQHVRAIDGSPEAIAIAQARVSSSHVDFVVGDIFSYVPAVRADVVFCAFWLSHVPMARFEWFWRIVRESLHPGGRAFFVDSLQEPSSTAVDHETPDDAGVVRRRLNDGREFKVVKIFHEPARLQRTLASLGWRADVRSTGAYFLYGTAQPTA